MLLFLRSLFSLKIKAVSTGKTGKINMFSKEFFKKGAMFNFVLEKSFLFKSKEEESFYDQGG